MRLLIIIGVLFFSILSYAQTEAEGTHDTFLVISDIHLNHYKKHQMEFAPKKTTVNNDMDMQSLRALLTKIQADILSGSIPQPQFILLLGDLAGHIRHTYSDAAENQHLALDAIRTAFPDIPVLYTFGNNDSVVVDYGLFRSSNPKLDYHSPLDIMNTVWGQKSFLSTGAVCKYHQIYPCILKARTTNGYYSAYLKPHLRLIVLNSVMFSPKQNGFTGSDRAEQLQWLESQLKEVASLHETALLAMHIPPGDNLYRPYFWSSTAFWNVDDAERFNQIMYDFHLSIIGVLAGHTHKDEIKLFEHYANIPIIGIYLNPALSTSHGNAPAVRVYELEQNSQTNLWNLSDYSTYKFNRYTNNVIESELLYQFQTYYCAKSTTKNMLDCLNKVTAEKIQAYFGAGNSNFKEIISEPKNIYITDQHSFLPAQLRSWLW